MQVYSIHVRRNGLDLNSDFIVVMEGFSWPAFFLNALWALWHSHWLAALAMAIVLAVITAFTQLVAETAIVRTIILLGWFLTVGFLANDMRRYLLDRAGFVEVGAAFGQRPDEALYSYLKEASVKP